MIPPLVRVTWNDAHSTATDEYAKAKHHTPAVVMTVGWLMTSDTRGVSLCCERNHDAGEPWFRGHTFIPRGIIVKIERL